VGWDTIWYRTERVREPVNGRGCGFNFRSNPAIVNLCFQIETCIKEEKADINAVMGALGAQIALVLFSTMMNWLR